MLVEVKVGALIMDPNSNTPIVVLKGVEDEAVLPIWVGNYEANAIALEIEKVAPQRPMTHDLLKNLIVQIGCRVNRVVVTDLRDNTFYAEVELIDRAGETIALDARPSDAIALALRADCPIFINSVVLEISNDVKEQNNAVEDSVGERGTEDWPEIIG